MFNLSDLFRKLENLLRVGTIAEADYSAARVRVNIGELTTDWLPWITQRASNNTTWHAPEVGEQCIVLSPSGEPEQGLVLTGIYQDAHPANETSPDKHKTQYSDGAVIEYDRSAHLLRAILPSGSTTELHSDGGLKITGDTEINGDVKINGNSHTTGNVKINGSESIDGDSVAGGISQITHTHSGVSSGSSSTGQPQ